MSTPKTKTQINHGFLIGKPHTFRLHVQGLSARTTVKPPSQAGGHYVWGAVSISPNTNYNKNFLEFTSTPNLAAGRTPRDVSEGDLTIIVTNNGEDDGTLTYPAVYYVPSM